MAADTLRLNWPQTQAYGAFADRTTICLPWGRGTGKSWFLRRAIYLTILEHRNRPRENAPGVRVAFLMPTLKQFSDIHGRHLKRELEDGPVDPSSDIDWTMLGGRVDKTRYAVRFPCGSEIVPFSAEDHTSKAARGYRADVAVADEVDDISIGVWQAVAIPWFSEPWSLKRRLLAGTPRRGRHGLLYHQHQLGISTDPADSSYHSFHATHRDAPGQVDPDEVERARREMRPEVFRREWECDFDSAEGLVYGEVFSESVNVRHIEVPHYQQIAVGVDWGFVDPGVMLVSGVVGHGLDSEIHLFEEHCATGQVMDHWVQVARDIEARYPRQRYRTRFYCDSSRPDSIKDLRHRAGVDAVPATHRIEDGVACLADKLYPGVSGRPGWTVDPACRETIREFGEYRRKRDPRDPDRYLEAIEDRNNHCMDAARYLTFGVIGKAPVVRRQHTPSES